MYIKDPYLSKNTIVVRPATLSDNTRAEVRERQDGNNADKVLLGLRIERASGHRENGGMWWW